MQKEDINNLRMYYLDGNGQFFLGTRKKDVNENRAAELFFLVFVHLNTPSPIESRALTQ